VRNYFDAYFQEEVGIYQPKSSVKLELADRLYVKEILTKIFFSQPEEYEHECYTVSLAR
jgi:hypothetical protein